MSDNAITKSEKYIPVSNKLVCPGIRPEPNRQASTPKKIITHLMRVFSELGSDFCATDCSFLANCISRNWPPKKMHTPERAPHFEANLKRVHKGMGFLSDDIMNHLYELADGDCPVCSVIRALQQFPFIVHYADAPPIYCGTTPCFLCDEYNDETNQNYYSSVTHIDALAKLDLDELPELMPPDEDAQVRMTIAPGQRVIVFLQSLKDGTGKIPLTVSDDDLWDILGWRPSDDDYSYMPSRAWMVWAKKKLLHSGFSDYEDLLHIFDMAFSWYSAVSRRMKFHRDGYDLVDGIRADELATLFASCQYLSQQFYSAGNDVFRRALSRAEEYNYFRSANWYDRFHLNGWYYNLTFIGTKEAEKFAGKAPCFFQEDEDIKWNEKGGLKPAPKTIRNENHQRTNLLNKPVTQSAAKSDATATGTGLGTGGDGGDAKAISAPVVAPENNATLAVEVKEGAMKNSNTVNIAGQGDVVRETRETVFQTLGWVEEKFGVPIGISKGSNGKPSGTKGRGDKEGDSEKADAALWAEWQRAKEANTTKTEFATDKDLTVGELQNALDRHRKRLGR